MNRSYEKLCCCSEHDNSLEMDVQANLQEGGRNDEAKHDTAG